MARRAPTFRRPTIRAFSQLTQTDESDEIVAEYVAAVLEDAEAAAEHALYSNCKTAIVRLPTNVQAPPMQPDEAIKLVYYHAVIALSEGGYDPKISNREGYPQIIMRLRPEHAQRQSNAVDQVLARFTLGD